MEERNKGLVIFGIILLAIGLVASFYSQRKYPTSAYDYSVMYPYQNVGIILIVAGIVFVALGLLYPSRKIPPPPPSNSQQPSPT
jgi:ABC-type antimicrobial peptide transport system permease subunit